MFISCFKIQRVLTLLLLSIFSFITNAKCLIYYQEKPLSKTKNDAVGTLLNNESNCPQSIRSFKRLLLNNDVQIKTSMVSNRGRNNPHLGSFSFFESIDGTLLSGFQIKKGEFFLGYFTALDKNIVRLDQKPEKNKLLIELIAWDKSHKLFNFYELRGLNDVSTRWYYRGNSKDALLDNQFLYRTPPSKKQKFGNRMRCSACHNSGGPIIKEIKKPHNDWWSNSRKLPVFPNVPDEDINLLMNYLVDAKSFSNDVYSGANKLNKSDTYTSLIKSLTLQEKLRPLFCTTEINIESNISHGLKARISIPSGFWLNPLLGLVKIDIPPEIYQDLLDKKSMKFPETQFKDADHAWLTPVKGVNDLIAIKRLIRDQVISKHFAQSVLMIDFKNPVFSDHRCKLLKLIPDKANHNWVNTFISQLYKERVNQENALLLATYLLNDKAHNQRDFLQQIEAYKSAIKIKLKSDIGILDIFNILLKTRQDVLDNELSKNPLGQILEPGFRVIFPVPKQ